MRIDTLYLESFRNYEQQFLEFDPACNVIYGENAQGKTNLLEALAYLSCGKSPRARTDRDMIRFGGQAAVMTAGVFVREREFQVRAELSRVYNTGFFCPEDLLLIREGAAARRRFLDVTLSQLRPRYAEALAQYHRTYEHKTRILRDAEERPDLLDTLPEFNERLVRYGAVLIHYRHQFSLRLREYAALNHRECSGEREELEIQYATVSTVTDPGADLSVLMNQLRTHMESHREAERASRLCLSGPHKDDLLVTIDGRDAKQYASQGQTRTAALSMKLAEREIYKNVVGEYPVLLLDDVLSELDPRRQEFVLNRIAGGQVVITCCEDDRLRELLKGKVFHIEHGSVSEMNT